VDIFLLILCSGLDSKRIKERGSAIPADKSVSSWIAHCLCRAGTIALLSDRCTWFNGVAQLLRKQKNRIGPFALLSFLESYYPPKVGFNKGTWTDITIDSLMLLTVPSHELHLSGWSQPVSPWLLFCEGFGGLIQTKVPDTEPLSLGNMNELNHVTSLDP